MATANFLGTPKIQMFDNRGNFLEGGKIYSYIAGTTTPTATYPTINDAEASTNPNTNPVVLDTRGEANLVIGSPTKLICYDANDNLMWSADDLGRSTNDVFDGSGNLIVSFSSVLNAAVWVDIQNNTTGNPPIISADGVATNVDLLVSAKGPNGAVQFESGSATFHWPTVDGANDQLLTTDGAGQLSWRNEITLYTHPPGIVSWFAGSTVPSGWLECNGALVSRVTYATLFGVIGTTFGSGDGSTTFALPDVRRRVIVGAGGTGTAILANTIGATGGTETHTLTVSEIPSHTHVYAQAVGSAVGVFSGSNLITRLQSNTSTSTTSTGGGGAHNNIQPSLVLMSAIKV